MMVACLSASPGSSPGAGSVGPVQGHHDGGSCADDVGHPAGEDVIDVDLRVGEQAIHLLGGMLGVQAAGSGQPLADGADRKGGAAQHTEGGVAERGDALDVQVLTQHAAKDLPDLIAGEPLLPDVHDKPRPAVTGREICWSARRWKSLGRIRKDMPQAAVLRFYPESALSSPDSFMSQGK